MDQTGFIWIDWCITGLILLSGIFSLWRGFVRESLSVLIWVLAIMVAWLFSEQLAKAFEGWITSYPVRITVAAIVLIIGVLLVGSLVNALIGKLITFSGLSGSDRLLGMFFGLARGVIIVTVIAGILWYLPVQKTKWWQDSVLIPKFEKMAIWSRHIMVEQVAPLLYEKEPVKQPRKETDKDREA